MRDGASLECLGAGHYLPNNRSPVLLGLDVMSILAIPDAPDAHLFSFKLAHCWSSEKLCEVHRSPNLTARPLTGPLASVPASVTFGCRGTIEWKAGAGCFFKNHKSHDDHVRSSSFREE